MKISKEKKKKTSKKEDTTFDASKEKQDINEFGKGAQHSTEDISDPDSPIKQPEKPIYEKLTRTQQAEAERRKQELVDFYNKFQKGNKDLRLELEALGLKGT